MMAYSHILYYLKSFPFSLNARSIALTVLFLLLTKLVVILAKCVKLRWKLHGMMPGTVYSWYNPLGLCGEVIRHKNFKNVESINSVLLEIAKEKVKIFGEQHSVILTWVGYYPVVYFIKADATEVLFRNEDKENRPWHLSMVKNIFGNGLLTSSGDDWKYQRKLLNPCFHNDVLKGFLPDFNEYAQLLVDTIRTNNKCDFLLIGRPVGLCVLEILLSTIFGIKLRNEKEDGINYMDSTKKLTKISYTRGFNIFHWSDIIFGLSRYGREADFHLQRMRRFTDTIIKERKGEVLKETEDKEKKMALMDFLIRHQLDTDELTDQNIREQVDTFMVAGLGTTRVSICWTLYLLGQYKDVQKKVHQELDEVFSDNRGGPITLDEVNKLKYLDRVLKECKRLYPPVPALFKTLGKDISVRGSTIPKGSTCFVLTYFIHRDKEQYPDPDRFDPDRFLPENCAKRHPYSFLPFSLGNRTCIGAKFSEIQEKVILATMLKQFTVESENQDDLIPSLSITLGPSVPIRIKFTIRNNEE